MPDPTCHHEDCTETVTHWHDGLDFGCYAPRTQPTPLDAVLAAAEDAKRAHDRLCDLAEKLLPESSPVKTADNPPVVLPTVDEVADAILASSTTGEGWHVSGARAALDIIAARMPVWVPVAPGTTIKAGTRYRCETADGESMAEGTYSLDLTAREGGWFIDPRTVPAEPEDPRVAAIAEVLEDEYGSFSEDAEYDPREYHQAAINEILAKLDGLALNGKARADQ